MFITTIDDFIKYIPTAEETEWKAISPFIESADTEIQMTLTGADLYDYAESLAVENVLHRLVCNLICMTAYKNAIPFVDLVQTTNGFAVVNNSNVSPASKERVERLILMCDKVIDRTTDLLITATMTTAAALAEWKKYSGFNDMTNCLFVTGIDFEGYFKQSELKRKSFLDYKNDLMYCQENVLCENFSREVIDELVGQIRNNSLTESNKILLTQMKQVLGKYAEGLRDEELKAQSGSFKMIYEGLKGNPTYEASATAIVRLPASNYENKQSDPTFFWG